MIDFSDLEDRYSNTQEFEKMPRNSLNKMPREDSKRANKHKTLARAGARSAKNAMWAMQSEA